MTEYCEIYGGYDESDFLTAYGGFIAPVNNAMPYPVDVTLGGWDNASLSDEEDTSFSIMDSVKDTVETDTTGGSPVETDTTGGASSFSIMDAVNTLENSNETSSSNINDPFVRGPKETFKIIVIAPEEKQDITSYII